MPGLLDNLTRHRTTLIIAFVGIIIIAGAWFAVSKIFFASAKTQAGPVTETELSFDPEGPYALLAPRDDGNALELAIRRITSYEQYAYQLTYTDDQSIERGVGVLDTWVNFQSNKTEEDQEVLLGTCSKNICKYDKGVEFGTLVLRFKKGNQIFRMNTQWHLQRPDQANGVLTSADTHFTYTIATPSGQISPTPKSKFIKTKTDLNNPLTLLGFTLVNDLSGAPKLPNSTQVVGKVYALNAISGKDIPAGKVEIELADVPADVKLYRYNDVSGNWDDLNGTLSGSKITAQTPGGGIFAVLTPSKN